MTEKTSRENNPVFSRRSIRKFLEKDVPAAAIGEILEAGRAAPSAKNRQPWKFIVYGGRPKQALLRCMEQGLYRERHGEPLLPKSAFGLPDARHTLRVMRHAPVLIIVMNTNGKNPFLPLDGDDRIAEICDTLSIGAAIENMLLTAENLGLGTLWIGNTCFAYTEMMECLRTEGQLVGAVALGYADEHPAARPRKELREIVEYRWEE